MRRRACSLNPLRPSVNYAIIGSDDVLSPVHRHAIIWTNAGPLLFELLAIK